VARVGSAECPIGRNYWLILSRERFLLKSLRRQFDEIEGELRHEKCPRQDSNLCTRLRRAVLYPLSYGGAFEKIISDCSCQDAQMNHEAYFATSYEQVCTGTTNHAETVQVIFDPSKISYQRLLEEFWTMHDPTSLNKQGGDIGTQYRSAIFTTSDEQMITAVNSREIYNDVLKQEGFGDIVTEIQDSVPHKYWPAEEYHQRYLEKNPNGYDCHSTTGIAFPKI
jgi:peptide-methionine (S)-S-oxide reductase